ncbi:inhibitor of nuclear factor kappa-B kinase subunit alpha isoform X2 [Solenopsis invicta]|uniref:inhibitor of nuclear factor kappa-B kinase subunit alpha isoform X2 n=1 Tax=Solenopsis invicta TaxID=13686 RepID=UPI00193DE12D|nr:inhibitor of nuclear factor kappa-B kinase subunit alpha isoform X2 [Solenopsis invicta]
MTSIDGWELNRVLGSGGFGTIELWIHEQTSKKIAIKKCKWNYSELTPVQQKRWANEVEIMKHLKHPNIVKTGCVPFQLPNIEKNQPILCMEYCRKGDLRKILNQPENCCGISETEAIKVMSEISSAVEYLHSYNITHRDLKPENIVLQDEGNVTSYKLIDLGYAKELGEASVSASLVGTLNYVAPELLWREKYSCSVDYWSLGILFYELVTGIRPFLPTMQHTMECCLRNKMVHWFRLVLQWDLHKRGKILDESGRSHLAVFTMLQQVLSNKILYVFCLPFYKINMYEIDASTTLKDLRLLIERDTNIEVKHQVLTDYNGAILIESTMSLASQINDHVLFLFRNGRCLIEDVPTLNIPTAVEKMMIQSKHQLNYEVVKDYYRHTIYFAKKEIYLFQLYIFAFSISVDLLNQKIDMFNTNMEKTVENIKMLTDQVHMIYIKYTNTTDEDEAKKKVQIYFDKVNKLVSAADQIKMKFMSLKMDNNILKEQAIVIDYTGNLSKLYNKMCDIYLKFKTESPHRTAKPLDMSKLVFAFMNERETQLRNENITDITRQLDQLQDKFLKLEKVFFSVTTMTKLYREEYQRIAQSDIDSVPQQANNCQSLNISTSELDSIIQSEDNVIYDNLLMRYRLDNLIAQIEKKYVEVIKLDP